MARNMCIDCGIRRIDNSEVMGPELCTQCLRFADIEVMHFDNPDDEAHAYFNLTNANCPVCNPEIGNKRYTKRVGHTNTVAKSRTSHADHNHPANPKHRAVCRKMMAAGNGPLDMAKVGN